MDWEHAFYESLEATMAKREHELIQELERLRAARAALRGENPREVRAVKQLSRTAPASPPTAAGVIELRPAPKSLADAACQVLKKANKPLHIRKIILGIQELGVGREQPFANLRASVTPTLLRRRDLFKRFGKGVYGLNEAVEAVGS